MNEPHDVPNISAWVSSVQAVVNAIRAAGATSQYILIPGESKLPGSITKGFNAYSPGFVPQVLHGQAPKPSPERLVRCSCPSPIQPAELAN